jgi:methionyl-tRNA synthetase
MAYNADLNLPYDVPANEFLNLEGEKFSKSRRWAVWLPDFLDRYDPDPLRYYLTAIAPETKDADFTWEGFVTRNNSELVAAWGNLVNRVLSFAHKRFDGKVPAPGTLDSRDTALLTQVEQAFDTVGELYATVRLRDALREAMALAREVNKYLDEKAPWKTIKETPSAAATSIYVAMRAIDSLKVLLAPVLPHTSERIHAFLNYTEPLFGEQEIVTYHESSRDHDALIYQPTPSERARADRWKPSALEAGRPFSAPTPLFKQLEPSVIEEEKAKLGTEAIIIR